MKKLWDLAQENLLKGPSKYYVSKEVGGVRKWQFLLIYSTIYTDVAGWVSLKKSKNMLTESGAGS
jgi:hypothetical protein